MVIDLLPTLSQNQLNKQCSKYLFPKKTLEKNKNPKKQDFMHAEMGQQGSGQRINARLATRGRPRRVHQLPETRATSWSRRSRGPQGAVDL